MIAEILAVGDEITSGAKVDTNSAWLSQRLEELGVRVLYHSTAGDEREPCLDVFRRATERADLVIATGGLGPTADDLTREILAELAGRPLTFYPEAFEQIKALFAARWREMPKSNDVQAYFPEGSRVIPNQHGTAPGIDLDIPRTGKTACRFFALPGVPAETYEMFAATVAPAIREMSGETRIIRRRVIHVFGAGESKVEEMLPDLIRRGRNPTVGITASKATISLRLVAEGTTDAECDEILEPTVRTIYDSLGDMIFGEGDDELHGVVVRLLKEKKKTLAVVEIGTRGMIADWFGETNDAAKEVRACVTVFDKQDLCAFAPTAALNEADGDFFTKAAKEIRETLGTDYAIVVGPTPKNFSGSNQPGEKETTVPVVLATNGDSVEHAVPYASHPALLKILLGKRALNLLRLELLKQ